MAARRAPNPADMWGGEVTTRASLLRPTSRRLPDPADEKLFRPLEPIGILRRQFRGLFSNFSMIFPILYRTDPQIRFPNLVKIQFLYRMRLSMILVDYILNGLKSSTNLVREKILNPY